MEGVGDLEYSNAVALNILNIVEIQVENASLTNVYFFSEYTWRPFKVITFLPDNAELTRIRVYYCVLVWNIHSYLFLVLRQ